MNFYRRTSNESGNESSVLEGAMKNRGDGRDLLGVIERVRCDARLQDRLEISAKFVGHCSCWAPRLVGCVRGCSLGIAVSRHRCTHRNADPVYSTQAPELIVLYQKTKPLKKWHEWAKRCCEAENCTSTLPSCHEQGGHNVVEKPEPFEMLRR